MANTLTQNPWKLDGTVGAVTTDRVRPKRLRWVAPTDASHTLTLHDKNGLVVFTANAEAVGVDVEVEDMDSPSSVWDGLTVPTGGIPSGAVYLTYA